MRDTHNFKELRLLFVLSQKKKNENMGATFEK